MSDEQQMPQAPQQIPSPQAFVEAIKALDNGIGMLTGTLMMQNLGLIAQVASAYGELLEKNQEMAQELMRMKQKYEPPEGEEANEEPDDIAKAKANRDKKKSKKGKK